jgi:hypothetical protein
MTSRERTLAVLLVAGILLGGGALLGYTFVYQPLEQKWAQAAELRREIDELDGKVQNLNALKPKVAEMKRQTLPIDPDVEKTKLKYHQMLEQLRPPTLAYADFKVKHTRQVPSTGTPEVAPKKPAYTKLEFEVKLEGANTWQVVDFLTRFYQVDLLHQVSDLQITRTNKPTESHNGLDVRVLCEAVIVDGAEARPALFPVPNAFAALGGFRGVEAIATRPDLARRIVPTNPIPVLASRGRDYSLIVRHDIFYGVLPNPPGEPEFDVPRLADVTVTKPEEAPSPVTVRPTGKGSAGAKVEAKVTGGDLFPKGLPIV